MKRRARGFTLLEVIIAFALLGLALTLLLGSLSGGAKQVRDAELRTRAVLHAQSLLAQAGVDAPLQVAPTVSSFDWLQTGPFRLLAKKYPSAIEHLGAGGPNQPQLLAQAQLQVKAAEAVLALVDEAEPPTHLVLGSDALKLIGAARAAVDDDIRRWESLSRSTDFADGAQLAAN